MRAGCPRFFFRQLPRRGRGRGLAFRDEALRSDTRRFLLGGGPCQGERLRRLFGLYALAGGFQRGLRRLFGARLFHRETAHLRLVGGAGRGLLGSQPLCLGAPLGGRQ